MKKKIQKYCLISVAALMSLSAGSAMAIDGAYMGLDLGASRYSNAVTSGGNYSNPLMSRLNVGYQVNRYVAAEAGYAMLGTVTLGSGITAADVSGNSYQIAAVGTFPAIGKLSALGKIGLGINQYHSAGTKGGSAGDILFGLGAKYDFNEELSFNAQFERFGSFGYFGATNQKLQASAFTAGLKFGF